MLHCSLCPQVLDMPKIRVYEVPTLYTMYNAPLTRVTYCCRLSRFRY
jgi:NADH:ubiquinone oxidoreductase subunit E